MSKIPPKFSSKSEKTQWEGFNILKDFLTKTKQGRKIPLKDFLQDIENLDAPSFFQKYQKPLLDRAKKVTKNPNPTQKYLEKSAKGLVRKAKRGFEVDKGLPNLGRKKYVSTPTSKTSKVKYGRVTNTKNIRTYPNWELHSNFRLNTPPPTDPYKYASKFPVIKQQKANFPVHNNRIPDLEKPPLLNVYQLKGATPNSYQIIKFRWYRQNTVNGTPKTPFWDNFPHGSKQFPVKMSNTAPIWELIEECYENFTSYLAWLNSRQSLEVRYQIIDLVVLRYV